MLSTEKRQALTSLMLLGEIHSVSVTDFDYGHELASEVSIHVKPDVNRKGILDLLYSTVGAEAKEKEAHEPSNGKQAFPYSLSIEGAHHFSRLFFVETVKEIAPLPEGAIEENILLYDNTEPWAAEDILRNEA